eukprot:TRINITY_DN2621_c3_g1_i1.p1 TRINITY_DN2621_c3_g1~~TRINITY_DN2621_c3_g1_i1.p1  ORF type:complete len:1002 (+),score=179.78 TRINITY_DN2621_c3_g1_i1:41-3046(+)
MIKSRKLLCETVRTRRKNEAGQTLVSEVAVASSLVRKKSQPSPKPNSMTKDAGRKLREKRLEFLELGKRLPHELKSNLSKKLERRMVKLLNQRPDQIAKLYSYATKDPAWRQYFVRLNFCSEQLGNVTPVHPLWDKRWWELMKSSPQGVLRHHMRELIPILEDRVKASRFQDYFDSTEIDILRRKGWVFDGRDGEPLKLTLEELRQKREADLLKPLDPTVDKAVTWMINRRKENREHSETLNSHPTYKAALYNEGDTLAYLAWRSNPIYAVMLCVYGQIAKRVPQFVPRSMLDFGSGYGTSIFCAVEIWKGINTGFLKGSEASPREYEFEHLLKRDHIIHPMITDKKLQAVISDLAEKEAQSLKTKLEDVKLKVEQGLLPSGSELELQDDIDKRNELKAEELWDTACAWKADDFTNDTDMDEDFLGEGMYSGKTKPFEETDYFLEKDHSNYPLPDFAKELEDRELSPNDYIQWFNVRNEKAAAYYKHVEKNKLERDPTYRPLSAMQYLQSKSETEQPDSELQSSQLHKDDTELDDDHPMVYGRSNKVWEKRRASVLSTIRAIEPSKAMVDCSLDMLMDVAPEVDYRKLLADGEHATSKNDLVVCSYTLSELKSEKLREDAIRSLWEHCSGILVIVEKGTPTGFKLVHDARDTILREYADLGPWESQPTILAPCQHDDRCPVAHSLKGHQQPNMRVCASTTTYYMSHGEKWALSKGRSSKINEEKYSYCIIARRDIIPAKSMVAKSNYKPTILSDKEDIKDNRVEEILKDEPNLWRYNLNRKILSDDEINQYPLKYLTVPENEMNMLGKAVSAHKKTLSAEELATIHKEVSEYTKEYRDQSWSWNRVTRQLDENRFQICTPHGTLDEVRIDLTKYGRYYKTGPRNRLEGALMPDVFKSRHELIQSESSNTLAPVRRSLDPIRSATSKKHEEQQRQDEARDDLVDEFGEEHAAWHTRHSKQVDLAKTDPKGESAKAIREELFTLKRDMGDALRKLGVSPSRIR